MSFIWSQVARKELLYIPGENLFNRRGKFSRISVFVLAFILVVESGCATNSIPSPQATQYQSSLGKVAIVTEADIPNVKFIGFAESKGTGASSEAKSALTLCLGGAAIGLGGGYIIYSAGVKDPVSIGVGLGLALFGVGSLFSCLISVPYAAIHGAAYAPGNTQLQAVNNKFNSLMGSGAIRAELSKRVAATALASGVTLEVIPTANSVGDEEKSDQLPVVSAGVNTVLGVSTEAGLINTNGELDSKLFLKAHVRLVNASSGKEVDSTEYYYQGKTMKLSEWLTLPDEKLQQEFNTGIDKLGSLIYDNIFLLYPLPSWGSSASPAGLGAIYPVESAIFNLTPKVKDLQPTLQWQSFPGKIDLQKSHEEMARIKNVRYDLIVSDKSGIIYRRDGLPNNEHKIEIVLKPDSNYLWTVRARFELDGRERVTEWSSKEPRFRHLYVPPPPMSYTFTTTSEKQIPTN